MWQYGLRILRYISFAAAIVFDLLYIVLATTTVDLIFIKGEKEDDANVYDILYAFILSYLTMFLLPTFGSNLMIVFKEITMNQLAWSKDEEYIDGTLYN